MNLMLALLLGTTMVIPDPGVMPLKPTLAQLPGNAPFGISVRVEPYADPLLRRPLDPKIVPLRCVAQVFTHSDDGHRITLGLAEVHLIAGQKKSGSVAGEIRTELTCDVSPDGLHAKTAVRVYQGAKLTTEQMSEMTLPGPPK
jgi:hypothetical protein